MKDKVLKISMAISIAFLQILLSELILKAVFGSSVFFETSGSAGVDVILFFVELHMGGLFLLTNLSILCDSKIINMVLLVGLWSLFIPAGLCLPILLGFVPGGLIGTFVTYKIYKSCLRKG